MKKLLLILLIAICGIANAQTCATGGCTSAAETNQYPSTTFSTTSSTWQTVSAYMNAGNWTLFNVTAGDTYEWTYCSNFGGSQSWDAELTLFNNTSAATLCYANNCGLTGCTAAPYIKWNATYTGVVRLLTTVSGCVTNTGSPYSTLMWRDSSGAVTTQILGIDVSSYQATINWTSVKAAGYSFAWAKATEGLTITDSQYHNNATNGVTAGVKMGAYHFAHPDVNSTTSGAVSEANHFLSAAQPYIISCELPPALDFEVNTSLTASQLTAWVQAWMSTVKTATGINPIIYTDGSIAASFTSAMATYCNLWIASDDGSTTATPPSLGVWAPNWSFNQYSWVGSVPGISGNVDMDVFNGNQTAFNSLLGCTTGIDQLATHNSQFIIYPNPANTNITIENSSLDDQGKMISIYNIQGQLIFQQLMQEQKTEINVSGFSNGIYIVKMKTENGMAVNKFVKQ